MRFYYVNVQHIFTCLHFNFQCTLGIIFCLGPVTYFSWWNVLINYWVNKDKLAFHGSWFCPVCKNIRNISTMFWFFVSLLLSNESLSEENENATFLKQGERIVNCKWV